MTEAEWHASADPAAMLHCLSAQSVPGHVDGLVVRSTNRKLRLFAVACCRQVWDGTKCHICRGTGGLFGPPTEMPDGTKALYGGRCPACPRKDDWHGTGRVGGLTDPRSRRAVEAAESFADGEATKRELRAAHLAAWIEGDLSGPVQAAHFASAQGGGDWARTAARFANVADGCGAAQADLLRCVFGDPFRPIWVQSSWLREQEAAGKIQRENKTDRLPGSIWPWSLLASIPYRLFDDDRWLAWNDGTIRKAAATMYESRDFARMPLLADALEEAGCTDADILSHCRGKQRCPECPHKVDGKCLTIYGCKTCGARQWVDVGPHVRGCWVVDLLLSKE